MSSTGWLLYIANVMIAMRASSQDCTSGGFRIVVTVIDCQVEEGDEEDAGCFIVATVVAAVALAWLHLSVSSLAVYSCDLL